MEKISTPQKTMELLERHGFSFKKAFGQNFLIDGNILSNIVSNGKVTKDTAVIEIGPGIGALTQYLADKAGKVVCFEIDTRLEALLEETLDGYDNVEIIFEDFLKADIISVVNKLKEQYKEIAVVANLPYYITTPIITRILETNIPVDRIVVMMQKEVAERLSAKSGCKEYGSLSIFMQYFSDVKIVMNVPKNVFIPKPNVDSAVIRLERREKPVVELVDKNLFFKLIRMAFTQRRKTIRNNLKPLNIEIVENVFNDLNLSLTTRAEDLTIQDFANIANKMSEYGL